MSQVPLQGTIPVGTASDVRWSSFRFLPPSASTGAREVDAIATVWLIFSFAILALVFGMMITFCIRYRNRAEAVRKIPKKTRTRMEWAWTIALTLIALGIGIWSDKVYFEMHLPPPGAASIYVVAKQWMWKIQHEDGTREINELHIPLGQAVNLVMSSEDVIHSFYVPAFRIKQDVLPGRYSYLWFKPTEAGVYRLFCAEFCGTSHSVMNGQVVVLKPADYEIWKTAQVSYRASQGGTNLASQGRALFTSLGCISCHGTVGRIAPPLEGLYMSKVGLRTGETVIADDNYIRESILSPNAKMVKGYQAIMPSFQGQVSEDDLLSLMAYIKSIQYADRSRP